MLKISDLPHTDSRAGNTFKVEGQVIGRWVNELRRVCEDALAGNDAIGRRVVLDLDGLSFLDAAGIALFRELAARNVTFTNCSVFIAEQLKEVSNDCR
jgi:anti-anti-sigma regulatory factor